MKIPLDLQRFIPYITDIWVMDDDHGTSLIIEFQNEGKIVALSFDLKIPEGMSSEEYFELLPIYTEMGE